MRDALNSSPLRVVGLRVVQVLGLALPAAGLVVGLSGTIGCETQPLYVSCDLDKEVTSKGICAGSGGDTSCVVTQHPHCDRSVCLSYFGKEPFCTQNCTGADDISCGSDAFCWQFAETEGSSAAKWYCVPNDHKSITTGK